MDIMDIMLNLSTYFFQAAEGTGKSHLMKVIYHVIYQKQRWFSYYSKNPMWSGNKKECGNFLGSFQSFSSVVKMVLRGISEVGVSCAKYLRKNVTHPTVIGKLFNKVY